MDQLDISYARFSFSRKPTILIDICSNERDILLFYYFRSIYPKGRSSLSYSAYRNRKDINYRSNPSKKFSCSFDVHVYSPNVSDCCPNSIIIKTSSSKKIRQYNSDSTTRKKIHLLYWWHQHASYLAIWISTSYWNVKADAWL